MAVAAVQRSSGSSPFDTNPMTLTLNGVATGNCLVLTFVYYATTAAAPTVSDSAGNTYTEVGSGSFSLSSAVHTFVAKNVTGGNITVTMTKSVAQSTFVSAEFLELSGADKTTPVDNHSINNANNSSANAGTVTVSGSGEYIIAIFSDADFSGDTVTAGTNYTIRTNIALSGSAIPYVTEDRSNVSANDTPGLTYSGTVHYCAMATSFKAAAASSSSAGVTHGGTPILRSGILSGIM
jgi:hypothetical protein